MVHDPEVKIFVMREGGVLESYQDHYVSDFGGLIPSIGDELPHLLRWVGSPDETAGNLFFVVRRRVIHRDGDVSLICEFREASTGDYELF